MDKKPGNPLAGHFRQPAIYFTLPSRGLFWEDGSLDMPANGELPIYPMTAKDEITLRTPDALLNGQGVVDVIQSCCPHITDAWKMPSVDVDAVLIAVRIASYGNEMTFDATCPHCQEENRYAADLGGVLAKIQVPDYTTKVDLGDIQIKLKPQQYFSVNATNKIGYEEERILAALRNPDIDDLVRAAEYKKHIDKIVELGIKTLADSTEYIEIRSTNTVVTDRDYIFEYYQNSDSGSNKKVQTRLSEISKEGSIPPLDATCQSCGKGFSIPLVFDYSSFFVVGS